MTSGHVEYLQRCGAKSKNGAN